MSCQLKALESAEIQLPRREKAVRWTRRKLLDISNRVNTLLKRIVKFIFLRKRERRKSQKLKGEVIAMPPLNLKVGERVRIKTLEEIKMTLDKNNKFQGLEYTLAMDKYCGGTFKVFKRVERAFDERKWKLAKVKDVVLLEGVFCDGDSGIEVDWDGCDRSCFLWWKEAWLERLDEESP